MNIYRKKHDKAETTPATSGKHRKMYLPPEAEAFYLPAAAVITTSGVETDRYKDEFGEE